MFTPSTSITSNDSTIKAKTVTPKPITKAVNPYQSSINRLNALQAAINLSLDTPKEKNNQEQPATRNPQPAPAYPLHEQ